MKRNPLKPWIVGVALLGLLLAACGGDAAEPTDAAADGEEPATDAPSREIAALAESSPTVAAILERGTLRGGVALAPPWLIEDPQSGELQGPNTLIMERLGEELGVEPEYIDSGWDNIVAGLQAGNFDIAVAPVFATPERLEVIDVVNFTQAGTCYLVGADNDEIDSLDDLNSPDVTFGTLAGTGTEQAIREKYPEARIDSVAGAPGQIERLQDVLAGRVDVSALDSPMGPVYEAEFDEIKLVPDTEECMSDPDIPLPIGFGLSQDDPAFRDFLEETIGGMQDEIDQAIRDFSTDEYLEIPA